MPCVLKLLPCLSYRCLEMFIKFSLLFKFFFFSCHMFLLLNTKNIEYSVYLYLFFPVLYIFFFKLQLSTVIKLVFSINLICVIRSERVYICIKRNFHKAYMTEFSCKFYVTLAIIFCYPIIKILPLRIINLCDDCVTIFFHYPSCFNELNP